MTTLGRHLINAPRVGVLELPDATHFVHLDRAERGRARLVREVLAFLAID